MAGYLFPLLTFPYVTRVLGVTNIGIYNFVDSVINYFILFSMLGLATVGVREIAAVKEDKAKLSLAFSSLLKINFITTGIAAFILIVATLTIEQFKEHQCMLFIGLGKLLFNTLTLEWFFKGIEDFRYITVRTLIVRSLYVVSVFIFVNDSEDYIVYFLLHVISIIINAVINIIYAKRFIILDFIHTNIGQYIKSYLVLGGYAILTSMYTSFNVAYLGFQTNPTEVGYYTTATKLYAIILSVYTAFTGVMLPRMSTLASQNNESEFSRLINRSITVLLMMSLPVIVYSEVFAPEIIRLIAGEGYEGAVLPMRIVMPLMLVIGLEQILVIQILMPLKQDRAILFNSITGATVGILLNLFLVKIYMSVGAALVWVGAEISVLLSSMFFTIKYTKHRISFKLLCRRILCLLPLAPCLVGIKYVGLNFIQSFTMSLIFTIGYVVFIEYCIIRDQLFINLMNNNIKKIKSYTKEKYEN